MLKQSITLSKTVEHTLQEEQNEMVSYKKEAFSLVLLWYLSCKPDNNAYGTKTNEHKWGIICPSELQDKLNQMVMVNVSRYQEHIKIKHQSHTLQIHRHCFNNLRISAVNSQEGVLTLT